VDKKQQVEYTYVGFYLLFLLFAAGLSYTLSRVNPRSYRRLVPPLGLITGLMIFGGILLAQHTYPGG
jgi:lipopolysaccharide export LptBFGC system permease protein LptF